MKKVSLTLGDYKTAPIELLECIESIKIRNEIADNWGTNHCRKLLDELIADTRCNTRKGFPASVAKPLIELSLLHDMLMSDLGYVSGEQNPFTVGIDKWKLPKNF